LWERLHNSLRDALSTAQRSTAQLPDCQRTRFYTTHRYLLDWDPTTREAALTGILTAPVCTDRSPCAGHSNTMTPSASPHVRGTSGPARTVLATSHHATGASSRCPGPNRQCLTYVHYGDGSEGAVWHLTRARFDVAGNPKRPDFSALCGQRAGHRSVLVAPGPDLPGRAPQRCPACLSYAR
jgi:hypothetical protein